MPAPIVKCSLIGFSCIGGTWSDGAIYFEVVPVDGLDKLLWIDSERFGYMINTVKEATLEREKQVVKNEKRQRVDNRLYGHTGRVICKALAPQVRATPSSNELVGTFTIRVRANSHTVLDKAYAAIEQAFANFEKNGFANSDLQRIKAGQETAFYNGVSSILDKALQLGIYNEFV